MFIGVPVLPFTSYHNSRFRKWSSWSMNIIFRSLWVLSHFFLHYQHMFLHVILWQAATRQTKCDQWRSRKTFCHIESLNPEMPRIAALSPASGQELFYLKTNQVTSWWQVRKQTWRTDAGLLGSKHKEIYEVLNRMYFIVNIPDLWYNHLTILGHLWRPN